MLISKSVNFKNGFTFFVRPSRTQAGPRGPTWDIMGPYWSQHEPIWVHMGLHGLLLSRLQFQSDEKEMYSSALQNSPDTRWLLEPNSVKFRNQYWDALEMSQQFYSVYLPLRVNRTSMLLEVFFHSLGACCKSRPE